MDDKRWIVYYDMYDKRGALLKHGSDNEVFASNAIIAGNRVRRAFHDKKLWPHVIIKVTKIKQFGFIGQETKSKFKQFVVQVSYSVENARGGQVTKHQETSVPAKTKKEAEGKVIVALKDIFRRDKLKATLHRITSVEEK